MTSKEEPTLVLGQKPEKVDNTRKNSRVVLYNPKTNLFAVEYVTSRDYYALLGGGIEEGHTELETAKKELIEESGYVDFEIISELGGKIHCYFKEEGKNQLRISQGFLAILKSEKNVGLNLEGYEKVIGQTCVWKTKEEIISHLEERTKVDFSYAYHLEVFRRSVEWLKHS